MSLIENQKVGRKDGAYTRLLGDAELGSLISQLHATTISAGSELEGIITTHSRIMTAEEFANLLSNKLANGVYLMDKKLIKKSLKTVIDATQEPDFVLVKVVDSEIFVLEMKDGDTFDTKKADGEIQSLKEFASKLDVFLRSKEITANNGESYQVKIKVCSFNQPDKSLIVSGLKGRITLSEAMTGEEFCKLVGISYQTIQAQRRIEQQKNISYFIQELVKIEKVRQLLNQYLPQNA